MKSRLKSFFAFRPMDLTRFMRLMALIGIIAFIICIPTLIIVDYLGLGGDYWLSMMFSDFAETLSYALLDNPYDPSSSISTIYSPISYLHLYPLALLAKEPITAFINGELTLMEVCTTWQVSLAWSIYFCINLALICLVVWKLSGFKGEKLAYLLIITLTWSGVVQTFFRGNIIILSSLLCLLFFLLYEKDARWKREVSLVCLGLAVSLKIFPAFLALLLLHKGRYIDVVKAAIYSVLFYLLPFLFVPEGFANIANVLNNLSSFSGDGGRLADFTNMSIDSDIHNICLAICFAFNYPIENLSTFINIASWMLKGSYVLFALFACFYFRNNKKKAPVCTLFVSCYLFFPTVSYSYEMVILLYPLILFLLEFDSYSKKDKIIYGFLFLSLSISIGNVGAGIPMFLTLPLLAAKSISDIFKEKFIKPTENLEIEETNHEQEG